MWLPKHPIFYRKVDRFCIGESLAGVLELFAKQDFNEESGIQGEEAVEGPGEGLLLALAGINARRKRTAWDALRFLLATQTIPAHFMPYVSNWFNDPTLHEVGRKVPVSQCSKNCYGLFHILYVKRMLAACCRRAMATIEKSIIQHSYDKMDIFPMKAFNQGMYVGYYSESLCSTNLIWLQPRKIEVCRTHYRFNEGETVR